MTSRKLFVTGGSGYIGTALIEQALAQGYRVHALSRNDASDAKLTALGAVPIRGDLTSLDILQKQASIADVAVHLALALSTLATGGTMEDILRIDDAAVDALAAGLKTSGGILLVTSGIIVKPDPHGGETDETAELNPEVPMDRARGERNALRHVASGVRVCVIRLAPWVYGRGASGVALYMGRAMKNGEVGYRDDGGKNTSTIHVVDAARLYLLAAEKGRSGEVYNGTSETNVTFKEVAEAIGAILGIPVKSYAMEEAAQKYGPFFAVFLGGEARGSSRKARTELGWTPSEPRGILEEIREGSYLPVVEALKKA